jgi:hypothetical protein
LFCFIFYPKHLDITDLLYSSVHDKIFGLYPPIKRPAPCIPKPLKIHLAVINAPPVDQDVPLYSSVQDIPGLAPE